MKNKIIQGQVIPINQSNIDTDVIIPKQYLKAIGKTGFGKFLFDSWRYDEPGDLSTTKKRKINNNFILNKKPYSSGKILIVNDNFGCGSSREHAVWAIKDYGIEAVISSSFAEIFSNNSFKNQLLLAPIKKSEIDWLFEQIPDSGIYQLTIDVLNQTISTPDNVTINFAIDQSNKEKVIHGYDDIELTLKNKKVIKDFEKTIINKKPWLFENE
ncbi:MAG: 3-isopropylmalate dehydratase small subunit [Pseudomonadota bacterium]|nr:3-isopropylmalate dehydratase small subunit [Pseudomonadota bacterium]MEC8996143.1 3-isopropylmalate dehydratase small subunit [Pseudomonadota bacterium]MED5274516.1 3-isopropylmalate dehydratase small subunit [Pseudomonadota bacterium]MED5430214.1 3-isopropylmalate dehydratase small subunit [Pseudomonadota bacterium]|tara:strand:+ start:208 stop:846 length:639 start_codon:yes stop_codon:yes gene_type:complete